MTTIHSASRVAALSGAMRVPVSDGPTAAPQYFDLAQLGAYVVGATINALDYGVKPDGVVVNDAQVTNAAATVTSLSYQFTAADIGKAITVRNAATTTTAISGFIGSVSNGVASLVTAKGGSTPLTAGRTASSLYAVFGTPNQTALNDAGAAAAAKAVALGLPAVVDLPPGMIVIEDGLTALSMVSWRGKGMTSTVFKYLTPNMGQAAFNGLSVLYVDCRYEDFGIDMDDVIVAAYSVTKKAFYIQQMWRGVFRRLWLSGSPASCIGVDFLVDTYIQDNVIINPGRLNIGGSGGAGIGIGTTDAQIAGTGGRYESVVCTGNHLYNTRKHAIFFETQSATLRSSGAFLVANNVIHMGPNAYSGIGDNGNTGMMVINNRIEGEGVGAAISVRSGVSGSSPVGAEGLFANNVVRNVGIGIEMDFAAGSGAALNASYSVKGNKISGCTSTTGAVVVRTSATVGNPLSNVSITDNDVYNNAGPGIAIVGTAPAKNIRISGGAINNNGTSGSGTRSAVYLGVPVAGFRLSGAELYDDKGSPTQTYGLELAAGAVVTDAIVSGNRFSGNLTGNVGLGSGASITGTTIGNQGWTG